LPTPVRLFSRLVEGIKQAGFGAKITTIACNHTDDKAVTAVFRQINETAGRLNILVNNAWGGYERMVEDGKFTLVAPFWQQPTWRWDAMVTAGVRRRSWPVSMQHARWFRRVAA
jgi:dehydrogenase/reductase SDR family member 1